VIHVMETALQNENLGSEAARADAPAGRIIPLDPDALLFQSEAAYLTGTSGRTLEAWRLHGGGPPFIALGRRAVRYRRRDLLEWIEARRRRSTSDPGSAALQGDRR
jgi:predicted DNA-binding transcriptional regulator AlpA